jgi:hypothetical protein
VQRLREAVRQLHRVRPGLRARGAFPNFVGIVGAPVNLQGRLETAEVKILALESECFGKPNSAVEICQPQRVIALLMARGERVGDISRCYRSQERCLRLLFHSLARGVLPYPNLLDYPRLEVTQTLTRLVQALVSR